MCLLFTFATDDLCLIFFIPLTFQPFFSRTFPAFHSSSSICLVNYSYQIALPHACPCWTASCFFFRLLLLKCQDCFEFWSCPPTCLQSLSAWCSLQRQSACFLCHQPSRGWKYRAVSDLGWVPVEPASVRSSQSVLKEQRPVHRWSSQQWCTRLQVAQSSPCIPSCVMGMSRETLSEMSLKSLFLLPFLQVLVPCGRKKCDKFDVICSWYTEVSSCSSPPRLLSTSTEVKLIIP